MGKFLLIKYHELIISTNLYLHSFIIIIHIYFENHPQNETTEPNFKQNFVFDLYEHRFGQLSLMVSQFNCNCIPFGISLGYTWHFVKTSGSQVLVVQLIIHPSWWRSSERLCLIVLSAACCCVQKSQVEKVHLFFSEVLICIFKHSVHALPVAAQWLMFKHIFAFEKKKLWKEGKYTFDQRNANENLTALQLFHSRSKCWYGLLARELCLQFPVLGTSCRKQLNSMCSRIFI